MIMSRYSSAQEAILILKEHSRKEAGLKIKTIVLLVSILNGY
jgi:hypothetical protein